MSDTVTKIVKTIKLGGEDKVVEIIKPSPKVDAEANMYASKTFSKLIKQKNPDGTPSFILRAQLDDYLREVGIYTEEDIKDIGALTKRIKELEEILTKGGIKKSEGRDSAIELKRIRYSLLILLSKRVEYDKNTVEHYSENARMDYLVSKCLCFEGGIPIFSNVEDYESDANMQEILSEVIRELASMVSTYDKDYESKLPENKFLKKYAFCDDKFNLVDSKGRKVDEKNRLINDDGELINEDGVLVDSKGEVINDEIGEFLDDGPTAESEQVNEVIVAPEPPVETVVVAPEPPVEEPVGV